MDYDRQQQITLSFDRGTLLLTGPQPRQGSSGMGFQPMDSESRAGCPCHWQWDARVGAWRCEAIQYASVRMALSRRFGASFRDDMPKPVSVAWPKRDLPELRAEQKEALAAWSKGGRRGQIIMPTGTGKTEVAFAAMAETQIATLVVAPVRDLMYQWHRRILAAFGYDAGIVGDNTFDIRPVTVTGLMSKVLSPTIPASYPNAARIRRCH